MADDHHPPRKKEPAPRAEGDEQRAEGDEQTRDAEIQALMNKRSKLDPRELALLRRLFPSIMRSHHQRIWGRLQMRGLARQDAKDIIQESMLALFSSVKEQGYPEDPDALVNTLVKGQLLNHLRYKRRHPESIGLPGSSQETPGSSQDLARKLDLHAFSEQLFASLPEELREVAELVLRHGLSHGETAAVLEVSIGVVKGQVAKAKRLLDPLASRIIPPSQRGPK